MRVNQSFTPLDQFIFGFDIGIASVGWCVLGENRIVDLGVRCFDKAETAKEGESLNLARRTARLMRRRLRRRAWRLTKLARLLKREGLIDSIQSIHQPSAKSLWQLRVEGLDRKLSPEEWAHILYHLCKHRGFHWISRAEEKKAEEDSKGEGGKVKKGLQDTKRRMNEKNYRSAAEMVVQEFPDAQRNKRGEYSKALSRVLLAEELALLFRQQREYGNPHATPELEMHIVGCGDRESGLFWEQKPALPRENLLKMLGRCTFEKNEYRAPKASFTAERHVWLTKLVNLKIVVDGVTRRLQPEEVKAVVSLPYEYNSALKYRQLHSALVKKGLLSESFVFSGLTGKKDKDPLDQTLVAIPAWQAIRGTLEKAELKIEWQGIAGAATGGNPELFDRIAWVLSVFKDGDEVEQELRKLPLPGGEKMIEALSEISFDKFHNLSLKALRKIVPHMEAGLRYDEACEQAGYHHSQLFKAGEGQHKYLPPFYAGRDKDGRMVFDDKEDIPRNPVVLRSLNQARKVLNALVRRYGSPAAVHIEMARDLSRPMDERNKIKKAQDEFRDKNEKAKVDFAAEYDMPAKSREFEKFMLYREQQGKCAYSLKPLDLDRVLREQGYTEVDHVLPYSRSYDNSKNNKVLVFSRENRDKGNRTPYEYLTSFAGGENGEHWRNFVAYVESNKSYRLAKRSRLLRKNFGKDESKEFMERNLNDTRYICKFFKGYVERHLQLAEGSDSKRCTVLSGQLTAFLRARWGLTKVRGDSDRHHALDAAVVAACSHALVKRLSDYSRRKELEQAGKVIDAETGEILDPELLSKLERHFPQPWGYFREELLLRLNTDDPVLLKSEAERYGYPPEALESLRPLFVSRAPQRRNSGAAHKETIYGKNALPEQALSTAIQRVDVAQLQEKHLNMLVGGSDKRNNGLRLSLEQYLKNIKLAEEIEQNLGKGKERRKPTLEEEEHIKCLRELPRKPKKEDSSDGPYSGNIIKKVKVIITRTSGCYIRHGIAELGKVQFTKLYRLNDEFFFQPCYALNNEVIFGMEPIPVSAQDTGIRLYDNDVVRISHPNLSQCYKEIRRYKNEAGDLLIDIEAVFHDGVFFGYWAYFEPSNDRPVVQLHDSASFYLLASGKQCEETKLTIVAKEKRSKHTSSVQKVKEYEYIELNPPYDRKPLSFSLEKDIKRQIVTATRIEKFHVDTLGNTYPAPPEECRGLA